MNTTTVATVAAVLAEIAALPAEHYASRTKRVWANSGEFRTRKARMMAHQSGLCVACGTAMNESDKWDACKACGLPGVAGNRCACGGPIITHYGDSFPEVAHHLGAKRHNLDERRGGYIWGNLSIWHKSCNRDNGDKDVNLDNLARVDLIVTSAAQLPKR